MTVKIKNLYCKQVQGRLIGRTPVYSDRKLEIQDINSRIETGIEFNDLNATIGKIKTNTVDLSLEFKLIQLLFLPYQAKDFDAVLAALDTDNPVYVCDLKVYNSFKETIGKLHKETRVRNISAIFYQMIDIVKQYLKEKGKEKT